MARTTKAKQTRAQAIFDQHYADSARFNGDEQVKKDSAAAKRAATGMASASTSFWELLTTEQRKALSDANEVLRSLAGDLDKVAKMASKALVDHTEARRLEREQAADATAVARWADDAAMVREAVDLASFMDHFREGEVDRWLLARPALSGATIVIMPDVIGPGARLADLLKRRADVLIVRRRAAEYLDALRKESRSGRRFREAYFAGIADYEEWRDYKRAVLAAVMPKLAG